MLTLVNTLLRCCVVNQVARLFFVVAAIVVAEGFTFVGPRASMSPPMSRLTRVSSLRMSQSPEELIAAAAKLREEAAALEGKTLEDVAAEEEEKKAKKVAIASSDGTLYDDEVEEYKETLSDGMKERLRREAQNLGADPNTKQPNLILYVSLIVGFLVVAGGQGILY